MYLIDLPDKIEFKSLECADDIEFIWLDKNEIAGADIMPQQKEFLTKAANLKP